jgi:transglutaminase-like putative cysteine protease
MAAPEHYMLGRTLVSKPMRIRYGCELGLVVDQPTPAFCLVDVHPERRHDVLEEKPLRSDPALSFRIGYDAFGNIMQRCLLPPGESVLRLSGIIRDSGELDASDMDARAMSPLELPDGVAIFLKGSRYCGTDEMGALAWNTFGHLKAGTRMVQAICDFTHERLEFDYQRARSTRTALQAYQERTGVCRDFTHLAITLCRAMNIPARYVNGYLGDIGVPPDPAPMDFNAWFEVYLGGKWYTFDARHNRRRIGRIVVARGRDACDVPMLHTFGPHILKTFRVVTEEIKEAARLPAA